MFDPIDALFQWAEVINNMSNAETDEDKQHWQQTFCTLYRKFIYAGHVELAHVMVLKSMSNPTFKEFADGVIAKGRKALGDDGVHLVTKITELTDLPALVLADMIATEYN